MAWTKAQTVAVGIMVIGLATYSVIQHHEKIKLRRQNESLQQQIDQLLDLKTQNENLSSLLAKAKGSEADARHQLDAVLKQRAREQKPANVQAAVSSPV